jgi:hypothetical protein
MSAVLRRRHSIQDGIRIAHDSKCPTTDYRVWHDLRTDDASSPPSDASREALKEAARLAFDATNCQHEQILVDLWSLSYPTDLYERNSHRWRSLGFQSSDPTRDLRGAGHLGLRHLHGFVSAVGLSFQAEYAGTDFPLALASFSVTAILCRYLELNTTLIVSGCSEQLPASDAVKRLFFELHAQHSRRGFAGGHDVLQRMHGRLLIHLARRWAAMATTIMDFHLALRATYTHLHRALTILPHPWTLPLVLSSIDLETIDEWSPTLVLADCRRPLAVLYAAICVLAASFSCQGHHRRAT